MAFKIIIIQQQLLHPNYKHVQTLVSYMYALSPLGAFISDSQASHCLYILQLLLYISEPQTYPQLSSTGSLELWHNGN